MPLDVTLYQSFYKDEQIEFLDPHCMRYDNRLNTTPDLREYPQMLDVHAKCSRFPPEHVYGLVSWKFEQKALITPSKFMQFVRFNPHNDFWVINPCFILESVVANPWEQGEWHHPGITQLARDVMIKSGQYKPKPNDNDFGMSIYPKEHMFFCNFFAGNKKFWDRLFNFTEHFYMTVEKNPDFKRRMMAASGYASDPNMSHFIFLFERLVPTFLEYNPDIRVAKYEYAYDEVAYKVSHTEYEYIQTLMKMKEILRKHPSVLLSDAYKKMRYAFMVDYPNSIHKE